uniref:Uncharacterized protein n=1 Tax=Globodera rostochiensis TaxID=31243 RepID=A0A914HYE2_GLORO
MDLYFFNSAKMAVVFILILLSVTLEAQNENDKFYDLMTAIGEHFHGEFNDAEKALELDLNVANTFLDELHTFASRQIVRKNENGARLEALVHGKNIDGTLKEIQENSKDKMQTFLAVPKCFILPDEGLIIFDYWIKIIKMKTKANQEPIFGVAIYKEKSDVHQKENSKQEAFKFSRENYQILKQLNDQKFSIYDLIKMMSDKMIDPELHLDSIDNEIRGDVQKLEESCKKFDNEEAKNIFLNNVYYELAINFMFNQRKDVHDRAEDLLSDWVGNSAEQLRRIIEALIGKEHAHQFNLVALFNRIKTLVEVAIPEEDAKFWKAINNKSTEQLENDIEFLKKNPKSIAEEKYQKAVTIICTIRQFGEKQYREDFGPELWEQTKESCNKLKPGQIKMEEIMLGVGLAMD